MSIGEGISRRYGLVSCFLLFFLSLVTQSWSLFFITLAIFLVGTADIWIWWLPGMSRREKLEIPLKGAKERKLRTETPHAWIEECVSYFRSLGFDPQISAEGFDTTAPDAEFRVFKSDTNRVWKSHDDATSETKIYARVLQDWGRISRGAFSPTEITELWEDEFGPVVLEFTHDRRRHLLQPDAEDCDIDLGLLKPINELIEPSGYQFYKIVAFNELVVACLTAEERQRLIADKGWQII